MMTFFTSYFLLQAWALIVLGGLLYWLPTSSPYSGNPMPASALPSSISSWVGPSWAGWPPWCGPALRRRRTGAHYASALRGATVSDYSRRKPGGLIRRHPLSEYGPSLPRQTAERRRASKSLPRTPWGEFHGSEDQAFSVGNAARASDTAPSDAIALLESDHREVEGYFEQYEVRKIAEDKKGLADKICAALRVHAQIEEELFYPAARKATKDNDLLDEATVEHAGAKVLIAEIEAMQPGMPLYDAKVTVLGEQIQHHVKEEEGELFPKVRETSLDLKALGKQMAERKAN